MTIDRRRLILAAGAALAPLPVAAQTIWAPFEMQGGKLTTSAILDGITMSAVLDSGGAMHAIDAGAAAAIGLEADGGRVTVRGLGGAVRGRYSQPVGVIIGGRALPASALAVVDLTSPESGVSPTTDLILGAPLFHFYGVDFDFERGLFHLSDRSDEPRDRPMLDLTPQDRWMAAPVSVPGAELSAVVDVGSDVPLILSPRAARRMGIRRGPGVTTTVVGGVGGQSVGQATSLEQVTFAGQTFRDVPVQIAARDFGAEANIGLGLLARFDLWLDFAYRRLRAAPNGMDAPFTRNLIGFFGSVEGAAIKVSHVAASSPADTAGLKRGDVITHVDGQRADIANARLSADEPGRTLALTLQGGETRNLTLARYY